MRVEDTGFPLAETSPAAPPPSRRRLTATDIADYGSLRTRTATPSATIITTGLRAGSTPTTTNPSRR
ncbi:MAG: hypothetical protein HND48_13685 [Chloroflexi bacterium]|nr:hypothetical protein [Chloroflexota bacterium]